MENHDKAAEELKAQELEQKERALAEKEEELAQKESMIQKAEERITNAKYSLYDRIDVSLGTMDRVIAILAFVLVAAILYAIIAR